MSDAIPDQSGSHMAPSPRTDFDEFVDQCALILEKLGKDVAAGCVCGYIGVPARVYQDDKMTVHTVRTPHKDAGLFEVVMYYDRVNKPHSSNPVIMRDKNGEVFRRHGEWTLLKDHVAAVAAKLPPQPLGLEAAIEQLQAIVGAECTRPRTLSVRILNPGGMSGHQTVDVISLSAGFDWEGGEVVLVPSAPLTRLSPEQVAAIQESVKGGTSYHAYQQQKKLRERIEELEAEVAVLNEAAAQFNQLGGQRA